MTKFKRILLTHFSKQRPSFFWFQNLLETKKYHFFIKAYQRQRRISVFFLIKEISVKFFHYFAHLQDDQIFSIRRKKFKLLPHDTCSVTDMGKGGRKVGVAPVCVCVCVLSRCF